MAQTCDPGLDVFQLTHSWVKAGALMTLLGFVLMAFGAQGIGHQLERRYRDMVSNEIGQTVVEAEIMMSRFERANLCQLIHGLAMMATGILLSLRPRRMLLIALWSFLLGTVLYSGCLFANVATGNDLSAQLSPVGGVVLLMGWLALVEGGCQAAKK